MDRKSAEKSHGIEPKIAPGMSGVYRFHFRMGFGKALERLRQLPGCRGLFDGLRLSASEVFSRSVFELAREPGIVAICRQRRVVAVSTVYGKRIHLCDGFVRLPLDERAAVIIHEALHGAGLPEWPADPRASTADEIGAIVEQACSLKGSSARF